MEELRTDYVDDVLDVEKNQQRRYQMVNNDDGTISLIDVTNYSTTGTSFGAKDINDTNGAVNQLNTDLTALNESFPVGYDSLVSLNSYTSDMYTFPCDGVVRVGVAATKNSYCYLQIYDASGNTITTIAVTTTLDVSSTSQMPVFKGQKCKISLTNNGGAQFFPFKYKN